MRFSLYRLKPKSRGETKVFEAIDRMHRREDAWDDACSQAEAEFRANGARKLNDATPGYLERINEIYDSLLPRNMSPNYKVKIREVVENNSDLPFEDENGEYIFLQEQLDALPKSDECVIKQIGKLILDSKKECCYIGKRTQQELFDVFGYLNCDWEYIVKLDGARGCPSMIKKLLHAYRTCEEAFQ